MAIELHHLHPSHDDEVSRLKVRIEELETNLSEIQSQKMQLEDDVALLRHKLEEERRWRKFPDEKPDEKQWILVYYGYENNGCRIDLRRWDNGCKYDVEFQKLYTKWMPLPSAPKEDKC